MNFSKTMKNHLAGSEISFKICIRLFLKDKMMSRVRIEVARHGAKTNHPNH